MKLQHIRIALWLVLAFIALGFSLWLTLMVTAVEDHPPLAFYYTDKLFDLRESNEKSPKHFTLIPTSMLDKMIRYAGYDPEGEMAEAQDFTGQFISIQQQGALAAYAYAYLKSENKDSDEYISKQICENIFFITSECPMMADWTQEKLEKYLSQSGYDEESIKKFSTSTDNELDSIFKNKNVRVQIRADAYAQSENKKGVFQEFIKIPANMPVKIILDQIHKDKSWYSCHSTGAIPQDKDADISNNTLNDRKKDPSADVYFDPKNLDNKEIDKKLYIITLPPYETNYTINCKINSNVTHESFTKRKMQISFFNISFSKADKNSLTNDGRTKESSIRFTDKANNFIYDTPIDSIYLDIALRGTENLSFGGFGSQDVKSELIDQRRIVKNGRTIDIFWDDLVAGQTRDVLLVLIGTLVAFFVTLLIEAVRLIIDGAEAKA